MADASIQKDRSGDEREVPAGKLAMAGLSIAAFIALAFFGMRALFVAMDRTSADAASAVSAYAGDRVTPPEPRLLTDEPKTWAEELAAQNAKISGYVWVDEAKGVARIPVERAMELAVQKGYPVRAAQPEAAP